MAALRRVTAILNYISTKNTVDRVMSKVKLVSASPGVVVTEFKVEEEHLNNGGTLHGGLTATLIDTLTTMAILSHEDSSPGVSTNLDVTYMAAAKKDQVLTITAECLKMGKTLAFTTAELKLPCGTIVARGNHTKHLGVTAPVKL